MLVTTCIERPHLYYSYFMIFSLAVLYITRTQLPSCIQCSYVIPKCLLIDKCAVNETTMCSGTCNFYFEVKLHHYTILTYIGPLSAIYFIIHMVALVYSKGHTTYMDISVACSWSWIIYINPFRC